MNTMLLIRHCQNLEVAQIAASHAHNLPNLIRFYSKEKLSIYWQEDKKFLERIAHQNNCPIGILETCWNTIESTINDELTRQL